MGKLRRKRNKSNPRTQFKIMVLYQSVGLQSAKTAFTKSHHFSHAMLYRTNEHFLLDRIQISTAEPHNGKNKNIGA